MIRPVRVAQLLSLAALWFAVVGGCAMHHQHSGEGASQLALNNGSKWATDEPLRLGMTKIKDAMQPQLPAAYAGDLTTTQYDELADTISIRVAYMVQNCKLDQKTDAMLHLVLADILSGVEAMQGKERQVARSDGARKVAAALENYGQYFDHPGWQSPQSSK